MHAREVWKARNKRKSCFQLRLSRVTLTWRAREKHKAESNSYASAFITRYTQAKHEPILNSRVLLSF